MPALESDKLHAKWPVFGYAVSEMVLDPETNGEPGPPWTKPRRPPT